jgi:hypothetical protein
VAGVRTRSPIFQKLLTVLLLRMECCVVLGISHETSARELEVVGVVAAKGISLGLAVARQEGWLCCWCPETRGDRCFVMDAILGPRTAVLGRA